MGSEDSAAARAAADLADGLILATVEVPASPARVFQALASKEVCGWWVRPGVFDTREWTGDVRPGGRWRASGVGLRGPYSLEGTFLEVDAPRRLAHTWLLMGAPAHPSTVTYRLDPQEGGTRLTLRHSGVVVPEVCRATCLGWETSFARLAEILAAESKPGP